MPSITITVSYLSAAAILSNIVVNAAISQLSNCRYTPRPDIFIQCCSPKIFMKHVPSFDECLLRCRDHNTDKLPTEYPCEAVSYFTQLEVCYLRFEMGDRNESEVHRHGCMSGYVKECRGTPPPPKPTVSLTLTTLAPTPDPPHVPHVGCGMQAKQFLPKLTSPTFRIINGTTANPHSWPWQVSIHPLGQNMQLCAGSLLRVHPRREETDIVMTAAHCVADREGKINVNITIMNVIAGKHKRTHPDSEEQNRDVESILVHPEFIGVAGFKRNDVALLKLRKPIRFNDRIRPICLPKPNEPTPIGQLCVAVGWGRTDAVLEEHYPDELQQLIVPVHDTKTCTKGWGRDWFNETSGLCAGVLDGKSGVCHADSGGILACQPKGGKRWTQHGIVSYGRPETCVEPGVAAIFTRVSTYVSWVQNGIKKLSKLLK